MARDNYRDWCEYVIKILLKYPDKSSNQLIGEKIMMTWAEWVLAVMQ